MVFGEFPEPLAFSLGSEALTPEEIVTSSEGGSCEPPCAVGLASNDEFSFLDGLTAALYIDFEDSSAALYDDLSLAPEGDYALAFSYEENQYGYSILMTSPMSDLWTRDFDMTTNLDFTDEYSLVQDQVMTLQIAATSLQQMALVSFSFGDELVRVHHVKVPSCETSAAEGACTNSLDCSAVDTGARGQSQACSDCFDGIASCTSLSCDEECAIDQAGNSCLRCQVEAGCHDEFMLCSGLDFLPWNSLEFPEW